MEKTRHPLHPILIVDDEEAILLAVDTTLRMAGFDNVLTCGDSRYVMDLLSRQLSSPVRWVESMRVLAGRADGRALEVGPGKVLAGLMKRIDGGVEVQSLSAADQLEAVL